MTEGTTILVVGKLSDERRHEIVNELHNSEARLTDVRFIINAERFVDMAYQLMSSYVTHVRELVDDAAKHRQELTHDEAMELDKISMAERQTDFLQFVVRPLLGLRSMPPPRLLVEAIVVTDPTAAEACRNLIVETALAFANVKLLIRLPEPTEVST